MPTYKTQAINLKSSKFGEADKILTLFTKDQGKIKAIAKGARRPRSKFGGRLEILAYNDLLLASGKGLDVISQCETMEDFHSLRESPPTLKAGVYLLRVVDASTEIGQPNGELFNLLLSCLYLLKEGIPPQRLVKIFEVRLMDVEGFFPLLDRCVECGGEVEKKGQIGFSGLLGGILCTKCLAQGTYGTYLPAPALEVMAYIKRAHPKNFKAMKVPQSIWNKLDTVLKPYISQHLGKDIKSLEEGQ